jgi:hypothetical protein
MAVQNNDSPLKKGLKTIGGTLVQGAKDFGSDYVQGAKDFGNRVKSIGSNIQESVSKNQGVLQTIASKNTQGGEGAKGSASPNMDASGVGAGLQKEALGSGKTDTIPSSFDPINVNKVVSSAKLETPQSSLGNVFNEGVKSYGSAESKPSSYYTPSGEQKQSLGGVQYTRDSSGNILRKDNSGNVSTLENRISSIGPNGTNSDGSPLSARDQAALDRSNQTVSDWKAQKERGSYQKIIDTELSKPFRNTRLIGEATDKLTALDTNDTNRAQISSQADLNARTLGATARKNAFEEQLNTQKLGVDLAKASSEAQGRLASQQNDTFKLIGEVDKNLGSTQDKVAVYKSRGMWNPLTIKASYPREKLGSFKTPDELRQNLVNDESIDQGDIEDIVFSYFPNNQ